MTERDLNDFIEKYDLSFFDGLIEVKLNNGITHRAVWVTSTPYLERSVDGSFLGTTDIYSVYYLLDLNKYEVWHPSEILQVKCLQQNYLSRHTLSLKLKTSDIQSFQINADFNCNLN